MATHRSQSSAASHGRHSTLDSWDSVIVARRRRGHWVSWLLCITCIMAGASTAAHARSASPDGQLDPDAQPGLHSGAQLGAQQAASLGELVARLASPDKTVVAGAITALGKRPEPAALVVLEALQDKRLRISHDGGGRVLIASDADGALRDPLTGEAVATPGTMDIPSKLVLTNTLRRAVRSAIAEKQLRSPDAGTRRQAAAVLAREPHHDVMPILREVHAGEPDPEIRALLALALAHTDLTSPDPARRLAAVQAIRHSGDIGFKVTLEAMVRSSNGEPDAKVRALAHATLREMQRKETVRRVLRDLVYGLSLGSLLLLAALGLAITFGLMGVINMAHGEMLMLGAYTTYAVQSQLAAHAPGALDWYLLAAVPAAFVVCFVVGMLLEATVIRYLYGRPLETLLATWGISLMLIQTVRLLFGAQNVAVATPPWLAGGLELASGVVVPYARLAIIVFAGVILALVWLLLGRTRLGLEVRAIIQNRPMARAVGIRTGRVDMLTFGLGSAIAGLGGVALSQIGNVGPELGQLYIVDSFMVVVVGGVGKLIGTVCAAFGLGVLNKVLEPVAGAVLGKIAVLALIILFIQRRPQGLFPLQGRSAES